MPESMTFRQRTFRQPTLRQRTFRQRTFRQNRQGGHFGGGVHIPLLNMDPGR